MTNNFPNAVEIAKFNGIRNTINPYASPLGSLMQADNVLINKDGNVTARPGYEKLINGDNITASYATLDQKSLFIVDSGMLFVFNGINIQPLINGLTDDPVFWCEESGERVFMIGGGGAAVIDNRYNVELIPSVDSATCVAFHDSRLAFAVSMDSITRIAMTLPYDFTALDEEYSFDVPDIVVGMQSVKGSLVIAGMSAIWILTPEDVLMRMTDYGCVPGKPITIGSDKNAYIWTTRGLCKAPEFANITQNLSSVPPGNGASVNTLDYQGSHYAIVLNDGEGTSYNAVFEI